MQAEVILITFLKVYTLVSILAFILGILQRSVFLIWKNDLTHATGYGYIIFLTLWALVSIYAILKLKQSGLSFITPLSWFLYFAATFGTAPLVGQLIQSSENFKVIHIVIVYLVDIVFLIAYIGLLKQLQKKVA
ncbi:MAG: hypothetical protein C5B53_04450 [Candidatus Melainabacteria bacterium]|nr:MAG: hypothetical protein C5B53_04450 [Candidatus Melainabacteria bacterium]